jgi:hypothetical protein
VRPSWALFHGQEEATEFSRRTPGKVFVLARDSGNVAASVIATYCRNVAFLTDQSSPNPGKNRAFASKRAAASVNYRKVSAVAAMRRPLGWMLSFSIHHPEKEPHGQVRTQST